MSVCDIHHGCSVSLRQDSRQTNLEDLTDEDPENKNPAFCLCCDTGLNTLWSRKDLIE